MVKSSKGFRSRSRGTFTKEVRERGMPPITRFLQEFAIGEKVLVDHRGRPTPTASPTPATRGGRARSWRRSAARTRSTSWTDRSGSS